MILYRIISEKEYQRYQDWENNKGYKPSRNWDMANKIYENGTDINTDYIYFFPYYEACLNWEYEDSLNYEYEDDSGNHKDYVIKVDIPDELVEHGIGSYKNPDEAMLDVKFVLLDECRIKREDFDPERHIIETVLTKDLKSGNVGKDWKKSEEFNKRIAESADKRTPLFNGLMLDYSGIPEPEEFKVPEEAKHIVEIIKRKLQEQYDEKDDDDGRRKVYQTINDKKIEPRKYMSYINDAPACMINRHIKEYGLSEICRLFNEKQDLKQIEVINRLLSLGDIRLYYENDDYVDSNIGNPDEEINKGNILYVAQEIAKIDFSNKAEYKNKMLALIESAGMVFGHEFYDVWEPYQMQDIVRYLYGNDLSAIDTSSIKFDNEKEWELYDIMDDETKTKEEKEAEIRAKIQENMANARPTDTDLRNSGFITEQDKIDAFEEEVELTEDKGEEGEQK